jgi:hypothetical protein
VIRFEPPLTVSEEQIDEAVDALDAVLSSGKPAIAFFLRQNRHRKHSAPLIHSHPVSRRGTGVAPG